MSDADQKIEIKGAMNTLTINVQLEAQIIKEKPGMYVSYCRALDLYSQGGTEREAKKNMSEAVVLFIESCYSRGVLNEVLKDSGFSLPSSGKRHVQRKKIFSEFDSVRSVKIPASISLLASHY